MACSSDLGNSTVTCPSPAAALHRLDTTGSAIVGTIHGQVSPKTVLVSPQGSAWLIDFARAGRGPLLADFVLLEEKIALDLIEGISWVEWFATIGRLFEVATLSDTLNLSANPIIHKALSAIAEVRQIAGAATAYEVEPYFVGLLLCYIYSSC